MLQDHLTPQDSHSHPLCTPPIPPGFLTVLHPLAPAEKSRTGRRAARERMQAQRRLRYTKERLPTPELISQNEGGVLIVGVRVFKPEGILDIPVDSLRAPQSVARVQSRGGRRKKGTGVLSAGRGRRERARARAREGCKAQADGDKCRRPKKEESVQLQEASARMQEASERTRAGGGVLSLCHTNIYHTHTRTYRQT